VHNISKTRIGDSEVLALIPARGGSKSVPRKNIRLLAGHSLLAYSIAAGLTSESITRVIVSTDDKEIAKIARSCGAEVPFMRSEALAQDDTTDFPVFKHALDWLAVTESYIPEIIVQLRPTSPLRPPGLVDEAVQMLLDHPEADSVRGVIPSGQNPYKMWRVNAAGHMVPLLTDGFEEPYNMPRQQLPPTYWQTGHIDAIRRRTIEAGSLSGSVILPLILDPRYAVDIDTERDHDRAEWTIRRGDLPLVMPGRIPRRLPEKVDLVLFDFDGVFTDDRVWVNAEGEEWVAARRGDGWGIARLKEHRVQAIVISTERNPVVAARCDKLGIEVLQAVEDKATTVRDLLKERKIESDRAIYVGNDVNDIPAFTVVGCALAVHDAHPEALRSADIVLKQKGGYGAVREVCDLIMDSMEAD
jgi:YrbI family 3-deoxy-D-manno-octulosonate 8-phosphate phosphatase